MEESRSVELRGESPKKLDRVLKNVFDIMSQDMSLLSESEQKEDRAGSSFTDTDAMEMADELPKLEMSAALTDDSQWESLRADESAEGLERREPTPDIPVLENCALAGLHPEAERPPEEKKSKKRRQKQVKNKSGKEKGNGQKKLRRKMKAKSNAVTPKRKIILPSKKSSQVKSMVFSSITNYFPKANQVNSPKAPRPKKKNKVPKSSKESSDNCCAVSLLSATKLTIKRTALPEAKPDPTPKNVHKEEVKRTARKSFKAKSKVKECPHNDQSSPSALHSMEKNHNDSLGSLETSAETLLNDALLETELHKKPPKAKKSFKSKIDLSLLENNNHNPGISNITTFKLTDVESVLGIAERSLSNMDSKTLDKIILQKAHKQKLASKVFAFTDSDSTSNASSNACMSSVKTKKSRMESKRRKWKTSYNLPGIKKPKKAAPKAKKSMQPPRMDSSQEWMDVHSEEEDEMKLSELRERNSQEEVNREQIITQRETSSSLEPSAAYAQLCDPPCVRTPPSVESSIKSDPISPQKTSDALSPSQTSDLKKMLGSRLSAANAPKRTWKRKKGFKFSVKKKRKVESTPSVSEGQPSDDPGAPSTPTPAATSTKTPEKTCPSIPRGISPLKNSPKKKLARNGTTLSTLLNGMHKSASSVSSRCKSLHNKSRCDSSFINTPNGVSYPVTPPYTPEEGSTASASSDETPEERVLRNIKDTDVNPVCSCTVDGYSFSNVTIPRYCQALDTVDNKTVGCSNKSYGTLLYRPSIRVPFLALCQVHRQRLRAHQCCPQCGQFCTQGKFYQCKATGASSCSSKTTPTLHHYHIQCPAMQSSHPHCPHCAQPASQTEVLLKMNEPRTPWHFKSNFKPRGDRPLAKMHPVYPSLLSVRAREETQQPLEENHSTLKISGTDKVLSTKGLPLGPDQEVLKEVMSLMQAEKPKKYRASSKCLFTACKSRDLERVLYMLMEGCDPGYASDTNNGQTALHAIAEFGCINLTHLLIQAGAPVNAQDDNLRTPLMNAAEKGHHQVIRTLLKAGALVEMRDQDGMTALHFAAKSGHLDCVRILLQINNTDINVKDTGGWTPVIWAAEHRQLSTVQYLLEMGADPCLKDNEENSGLHWASFSGCVEIAEMFLNAGCDIESPNEHGDRPLHIAARQDHYECIVLFLLHQANIDARNNENDTALDVNLLHGGATYRALYVYRELRKAAASRAKDVPKLLHRDISYGREANPVPVVNECDDENYPHDFLYVNENVETIPLNINRTITSLRSCTCQGDCSSMHCVCGHSSIRCWYTKEGLLKEDFNYADPPLLFECNKACHCWASCQNRVVQLGINARLQVFRTVGRGWGCRVLQNVPKGSFVCEYVGELISDAEADSREDDSYLFDLDNKDVDTFCVDARKYGNVARFINHLCFPNLVPVKVFIEHQDLRFPRICFFASRDIAAGEELGFDYGDKFWIIKWKQFTCSCGSEFCRYSKDTIHKTIEDYNKRMAEEEAGRKNS